MTLQPLGARILVRRLPPPEQTKSGLYLLGREYPTIGRVIDIGVGKKTLHQPFVRSHLPEVVWNYIHVGDQILFHRDAIAQENVLEDGLVMLSREHCLAYYEGNTMKVLRPLGDRVLLKRIDEVKQIGSIHLPDQSVERPQRGIVVAVGMGRIMDNGQYVACDVKIGDRVLFGKFMGSEIKLDGEEHLLVREDDIMGIEHD